MAGISEFDMELVTRESPTADRSYHIEKIVVKIELLSL